jgi:CYTH domain-containing protein/predicted ATPase
MLKDRGSILSNLGDNIKIIVITGGPCAGKTTGLARLKRMLSDRGHKVLISPESATKLIEAGMTPGELSWNDFQEQILLDALSQEERIISIATKYRDKGQKVVVLCDRGAMDGEAYVGPEEFGKLLKRLGFTHRQLCDERYHAVMHLQTAALGAETFYKLSNNKARKETLEEARALDKRTLDAWTRHQHPRVINNSTDFRGKIDKLFAEISAVLGDPIPLEKEEKYLIELFNPKSITVPWYETSIVQDYLLSPNHDEERRLRLRSDSKGATSYYYTIKKYVSSSVRAEEEKIIQQREYDALLTLRDPNRFSIRKKRICFFWNEQFIEIDFFDEPHIGLALVEAEYTDKSPVIKKPPFIKIIRNVTNDKKYSNAQLARYGHVGKVLA